jgi:hypothetical protein
MTAVADRMNTGRPMSTNRLRAIAHLRPVGPRPRPAAVAGLTIGLIGKLGTISPFDHLGLR